MRQSPSERALAQEGEHLTVPAVRSLVHDDGGLSCYAFGIYLPFSRAPPKVEHFGIHSTAAVCAAPSLVLILESYRSRIYEHYVAGMEKGTPITLQSLRALEAYQTKLIRDHFPSNKQATILDLGCGHGTLLYFCQQLGYRNAVGVDRSPEQVQKAAELGIAGVVEGDLMTTLGTLAEASQDVVVAFDVIEHFSKAELLPFIDEVKRVLKSDGKWIIHCPNGESPFFGRIRYGDFTHENIFTRNSISQILKASGFESVWSYEDKPVPRGLASTVRAVLWEIFRFPMIVALAAETGAFDRRTILSQNLLAVASKQPGLAR